LVHTSFTIIFPITRKFDSLITKISAKDAIKGGQAQRPAPTKLPSLGRAGAETCPYGITGPWRAGAETCPYEITGPWRAGTETCPYGRGEAQGKHQGALWDLLSNFVITGIWKLGKKLLTALRADKYRLTGVYPQACG
jgi:hypothetical protein